MGSSTDFLSPEFSRKFAARAAEASTAGGLLSFRDFMELALYDDELGYYRQQRQRVGTTPEADFYTASTFKNAFAGMVTAAATKLLAPGEPQDFTFVEIGAEPGRALLDGVEHPFAAARVFPYGTTPEIPPKAIVFSNELFDAQPFDRVVFRGGKWHEWGVRLQNERLEWELLPEMTQPVRAFAGSLPMEMPEDYTVDLPLATRSLLKRLVHDQWSGLFLAFDYGKSWRELTEARPEGTARAYYRHQQSNDLLAHPGEQDLTCHVCWDWLENDLGHAGFCDAKVEDQEAFFVHHSMGFIEKAFQENPSPVSPMRTQIKQLIHPTLMGQKFQVLAARRDEK